MIDKYDATLRPKLTQFRAFFQNTNFFYLVACLGLLDVLLSLLTYGIFSTVGLAGAAQLMVLMILALLDAACALYSVVVALKDGVKMMEQWKKELYIYFNFFIFFVASPLSRIVLALISLPLSSLGIVGGSMYITWGSIVLLCVWLQTMLVTFNFPLFVQELTYLVELVRATTPGDKDLA